MSSVQVVSGFLEAGKTTFINTLLCQPQFQNTTVAILCFEQGFTDYQIPPQVTCNILYMEDLAAFAECSDTQFQEYDHVLIEYNGTWSFGDLVYELPKKMKIEQIFHLLDGTTFSSYMTNIPAMQEQIAESDIVLINRAEKEQIKEIRQQIYGFNQKAVCMDETDYFSRSWKRQLYAFRKHPLVRRSLLLFVLLFGLHQMLLILRPMYLANDYSVLSRFVNIFAGIIIQAIPYIFLGVLVSSLIQILMPPGFLFSLLTKYSRLGYPIAILLGLCIPVCDCAMLPVTVKLLEKGTPPKYAMTFLVVSATINPIALLSTYYAFYGQPQVLVVRIILSLCLAVAAGVLIQWYLKKTKQVSILKSTFTTMNCMSSFLQPKSTEGWQNQVTLILRHTAMEFFNIMQYVLIGAFLSTGLQMTWASTITTGSTGIQLMAYLYMLLAAFFMSICASSNAFIAKALANTFPLSAVMLFMVMGPLLDHKNLLLMSRNFKYSFIFIFAGMMTLLSLVLFPLLRV